MWANKACLSIEGPTQFPERIVVLVNRGCIHPFALQFSIMSGPYALTRSLVGHDDDTRWVGFQDRRARLGCHACVLKGVFFFLFPPDMCLGLRMADSLHPSETVDI